MRVKKDPAAARSVELASGFTVGDYLDAVNARNRDVIAEGIHRRFTERYLEPVTDSAAKRHGFTMMAIASLMIEALQSFRLGWADTRQRGRGEEAFCPLFYATGAF